MLCERGRGSINANLADGSKVTVFFRKPPLRGVERFLENLDFHGLAAEQALQFAHPSFQLTDTARADDIFVSLDRSGRLPAFVDAS